MNNNTDSEGNSSRNGNQESDATPKPLPLKRIIWWSVPSLVVLIGIVGLCFGWAREYKWFDPNYVIDHEVWGTFGDFVGGVLGIFLSLLACILMVWTFHEQRKLTYQTNQLEERLATKNERFQKELTKSTNDQAELQRFNDLFFHLLELYRDQNAILNP